MAEIFEELTLGRLLAYFRNRRNMTIDNLRATLRGGPTQWQQSQISRIENDQTSRLSQPTLNDFAQALILSPVDYSWLLRAADFYPQPSELHVLRQQFQDVVNEFAAVPAYVVDYRSGLQAFNEAFAHQFAPLATNGTPVAPVVSTSGTSSQASADATSDLTVVPTHLTCGPSVFAYMFNRQFHFWSALPTDQREGFGAYMLRRFWRATLPLLQPKWEVNEFGEPPWLTALVSVMSALPSSEGATFARLNTAARYLAQSDRNTLQMQSIRAHLVDRYFFHLDGCRYMLIPNELEDARFHLLIHLPL